MHVFELQDLEKRQMQAWNDFQEATLELNALKDKMGLDRYYDVPRQPVYMQTGQLAVSRKLKQMWARGDFDHLRKEPKA